MTGIDSLVVAPPHRRVTLRAVGMGALLAGLLCGGCAVPQPRGQGKLERIVEPTTHRGYWLYLPRDYVRADEAQLRARRWPLVVTFHGMKPFDNAYPQAREWEQEADRYGFIVVAPELRAPDVLLQFPVRTVHPAFKSDEEATLAILDHVFANTYADPSNVMATSWSSGGYMAHYMLNRHPDRFTCLGVRQSNFSSSILDPEMTKRSIYHPIFIVNTQNDFAICRKESREAVQWYKSHGYKNVAWVVVKDKGHERTPDMAADFFGRVARVAPTSPPTVLARRQAIDGNPEGLALLSGQLPQFEPPPGQVVARRVAAPAPETPPRPIPKRGSGTFRVRRLPSATAVTRRAEAIPSRSTTRSPVSIRLSSAIGIEPLHLGFSAECPASWYDKADFLWTLDGQHVTSGVNGQMTLTSAGRHTLGLLVVTQDGREYRAQRTIRVLPRLREPAPAARSND